MVFDPPASERLVLGIHTAQAAAGLSLVRGETVLASRLDRRGFRHSRTLLARLHRMLEEAEVDLEDLGALAVCTGPGSFTGIRVGMALARALAFGAGLPLVGVTSFEAYAVDLPAGPGTRVVIVDARRGEIYVQAWPPGAEAPSEPRACSPEAFRRRLVEGLDPRPVWLGGDGLEAYADLLLGVEQVHLAPAPLRQIRPEAVAWLGCRALAAGGMHEDPAEVQPVYVRRSDRELGL